MGTQRVILVSEGRASRHETGKPAMGCGVKTMRTLLFVFNFLFSQVGIFIIVCGCLGAYYMHMASSLVERGYFTVPVGLIIVGLIIFIFAFFGCCGAITQNTCMLITFSTLLVAVIIVQVALGALTFFYRDRARTFTANQMKTMMLEYYRDIEFNQARSAWDFVQSRLKCCGVNGPQDWVNLNFQIPDSCGRRYMQGCLDALIEKINQFSLFVIIAGVLLAVIELLAICFACMLANYDAD